MRADELAEDYPVVRLDSDAVRAAKTIATKKIPGLIVVDDGGAPYTVLPGSQVLRFVIPQYIQDDVALARVFDEKSTDELLRELRRVSVRDLLPRRQDVEDLPVVDCDASMIEVAAVMARFHSPLCVVLDDDRIVGAIRISRLMEQLLADVPADS